MRVYVIPSVASHFGGREIQNMFRLLGHTVLDQPKTAEVLVFTGGSDVHPSLYGEAEFPHCHYSIERDIRERTWFNLGRNNDLKMIGICRGAQFLNVMSGGRLWHDVDNHGRSHEIVDISSGKRYQNIISTHHQMMIPAPTGEVLATAKVANNKKRPGFEWNRGTIPNVSFMTKGADGQPDPTVMDIEAVWYEDTQCLCYQPHPEYGHTGATRDYFVELLNRFIIKKEAA